MITVILLCFLDKFVFVKMIAWFQTRALPRFQNGYGSLVGWSISHPVIVMLGVVVLFIGSFVAVGIRKPAIAFFPKGDPKFIYTYLKMPVGTRVEVTDSITKVLEKRIYGVIGEKNPDVESVITNVAIGAGDPGEATAAGVSQSHMGKVGVAFKELSERTGPETHTYMDKIREVVKGIPGAEVSVDQEASGPPTGKEIAIEVAGDDYPKLAALSKKVIR
jgi:multidrug efflux pump